MQAFGLDHASAPPRIVAVDGSGRVVLSETGTFARLVKRHSKEAGTSPFGVAADTGAVSDAAANVPGIKVHRCSPGTAAVIAETWVGAARGARHAVCLVIGDRVFSGILLDGKPWSGAHGHAGAAAWLALNPVERQDYRKFGSLAAEVSNKGIARRLSWRIQAGDHSTVLERAGDLEAITAAHVFEGARSGDGVSISVVRETAKYIGMAVANLVATVDPEVVVLGGSISAAGDLLLDSVRQECARRLPPDLASVRVEISPLGDDSVAIGAARLAMLAAT